MLYIQVAKIIAASIHLSPHVCVCVCARTRLVCEHVVCEGNLKILRGGEFLEAIVDKSGLVSAQKLVLLHLVV